MRLAWGEESHRKIAIWASSGLFSAVVLIGHELLENPAFTVILIGLALAHLGVVSASRLTCSSALFTSQSLIAISSVSAVVLYVLHTVGPVRQGIPVLSSFLSSTLSQPSAYFVFCLYLLCFLLVLSTLVLVVKLAWSGLDLSPGFLVTLVYAASAVNIAVDYSLWRPLLRVSGEPGADSFFFAAGLFGMEYSLPLHLLCAGLYILRCRRARLSAGSDAKSLRQSP